MADFQPIIPTDNTLGAQPEANNFVPSVAQPEAYQAGSAGVVDPNTNVPSAMGTLSSFIQTDAKANPYSEPVAYNQQEALRYPQYNTMLDNEENYAASQSWYEKWGNGLLKMGTTALGTFAEGMMSIPDLMRGATGGNIYKNPASQWIDEAMDNMENKFPNYYTKWETDHPIASFFTPTGFANAWSDKFFKNLGFTIGAISSAVTQDLVIGALTGGVGELPLLSSQIGKASLWFNKILSGTNKLDEVLATTAGLASTESLFTLKTLATTAQAQKLKEGARYLTTLTLASNTEAAIQGRHGYNNLKKQLIADFQRDHGYAPEAADLDKIEEYATAAGNTEYGINMAILTVSNAVQFEHLLKPWNAYRSGIKKGIEGTVQSQKGRIGLAAADDITTAADVDKLAMMTTKGRFGGAWDKIKPIIPNILAEGVWEEGTQFAAEVGVADYFSNKYNGKIKGGLDDILASTLTGLGAQFGTTAGWENMFIGGLTGMLVSPVTGAIENAQMKRAGVLTPENATKRALGNLNAQGVTGLFQNNYNNAAQTLSNNGKIAEAVNKQDVFAFANLKADSFFNFVMSGVQNNRYDVRKEQLEILKELPDEELNKLFGIEEGTRASNHAYIDQLIRKADALKKSHDAIANVFSNPYTLRGEALNEEHEKENKAWYAFEDYKSALVKFSYNTTDFNSRLGSIEEQIKSVNSLLSNELVSRLSSPRPLNELKNEYKESMLALQKQLDEKLLQGDDRIKAKEQIKAFATRVNHIEEFLDGNYDNMKLFPELADFEINNRDVNGKATIDKAHTGNLISFGHDINRINVGKRVASEAYDYLLTQEGFNDFNKHHEEWKNSLNLDENYVPTEEETAEEVPETGFTAGREYKPTKQYRYTVVKNGDKYDLKNPFGEVEDVYATREEAEKVRDAENSNITDKLARVEVLGLENGKLKIKDKDGNIQYIDPRLVEGYAKVLNDAEILAARADFNKTIIEQQSEAAPQGPDYDNPDNDVAAEDLEREESKKFIEILFNSTTFDPYDSKEYTKRTQAFLTNIDKFPDNVAANVKAIVVTKNNEDYVGAKGLTDYLLAKTEIDPTDPQQAPIVAVFTIQDSGEMYFVDVNGKKLGKVGEPAIIDKLVFATLPTADLSYRRPINGSDELEKRYPAWTDDALAQEYHENWKKRREEIFPITDNFESYNFFVSRGVPFRNELDEDGKPRTNSVIDALVTRKDLKKQGLVVVSTGTIAHQGRNIPFPAGSVFLQNGNTLEYLTNRTLAEREVDTIYDAFDYLIRNAEANDGKLNQEVINYLQSVIYYSVPKDNKAVGANQVFINEQGYLVMGEKSYPFTSAFIGANEDIIKDSLRALRVNANNQLLKTNDEFREIVKINPETGEINTIIWRSYQHYLLSDKYEVSDNDLYKKGSSRRTTDIPFTTSIRKIDPNVENDSNYLYKYATLDKNTEGGDLFEQPKPAVEEPKAERKTRTVADFAARIAAGEKMTDPQDLQFYENNKRAIENTLKKIAAGPVETAGTYILDGKTENTFSGISFIAEKVGEDYAISIDPTNERYQKNVKNKSKDEGFLKGMRDQGAEGTNEEIVELWMMLKIKDSILAEMTPKVEEKPISKVVINTNPIPVLDGQTQNVYKFGNAKVLYTGRKEDDGLVIEIVEDDEFKKAVQAMPPRTVQIIRDALDDQDITAEEASREQLIVNIRSVLEPPTPATTAKEEVIKEEIKEIKKEVPEEKIKEEQKSNDEEPPISDIFKGDFRMVTQNAPYQIMDVKKETQWWEDNLSLPLNVLDNLIQSTGGGYAFGMFYDAAAYVYSGAETGTVYHEAFHAVWTMYNSTAQRKGLMKEFNSRTGSFTDYETGKTVNYADATEHQINEQLAEEFRAYVQDGTHTYKPARTKNLIARFFEALKNFFTKLFSGNVTIAEMFDRINSGYYKTAAPNAVFNRNAQYKITGLDASDSYKVTKGITVAIIQNLFRDNRSLVEFDSNNYSVKELFGKVREQYNTLFTSKRDKGSIPNLLKGGFITETQAEKYMMLWNNVQEQWDKPGGVTDHVKDYLKTFGVIADITNEDINNVLEEGNKAAGREDEASDYGGKNADSYVADQFTLDVMNNASASIKLLLATIAEAKYNNGEIVSTFDEGTMMQSTVNYSKLFGFLLNQLHNYNTFGEKKAKLIELAEDDANIARLVGRLKLKARNNLTLADRQLQAKFFNVFSKQRPSALRHIVDKKTSVISSANLNVASDMLAQSWINKLKVASREEGTLITTDNGVYTFNGINLRTVKKNDKYVPRTLANVAEQVDFLKEIGSEFTVEVYNKLDPAEKKLFNTTTQGLFKVLSKKNKVIDITSGTLDSAGNYRIIAELYLKGTGDAQSTFGGLEGDKRQMFVQQNMISNVVNDLTNASNKEELLQRLPQLKDAYRKDGLYINKYLFDEDGDKVETRKLTIGYNEGIYFKVTKDVVSNANLSLPARIMEEINQNLSKNYYILVPADSKTEWTLAMEHIIPFKNMVNTDVSTDIYNIFNAYYKTERALSLKTKDYKSTMYDIAGGYATPELDKAKFSAYMKDNVNSLINFLMDSNIIKEVIDKKTKKGTGKFTVENINTKFTTANGISKEMSREELYNLFKFTEANYMINNIELHKLFFGDLNEIPDPLKRYKSFMSPRETSIYNAPEFNNALNNHLNKVNGIELQENDYGYWEHKDNMNTVTMVDTLAYESSIMDDGHLPESITSGYDTINGADAQSWAFLPAYREILWKSGGRFTEGQEKLYQFLAAQDRQMLAEDGHYTYNNPQLEEADKAIVATGYKGDAALYIIKPIGSGVTQKGRTFLDKTSLAPLTYSRVRGTNMEPHYLKMWNQKVSYLIMESGRKIGAQGADAFYNEDGTINTNPFAATVNIPFRYYGIQVETAGSHNKNTLGTQLSTEAFFNLRNAGVPIDFDGGNWYDLADEAIKENASPIYKAIRRNVKALEALQVNGYNSLLEKLGIEDMGDRFSAPDKTKVVKLLHNELFRREAPQNLKDAIALDANGDFVVPFEAIPNYKQIKEILFSYVDKLIAKPKVTGGPRVQMSGLGFETGVREVKKVKVKGKDKVVYVSNGLKFYKAEYDAAGKRTSVGRMEVLLPMWFADKLKNHPKWRSKTDQEILSYLNNTEEGRQILTGIGFRIPTQELNSVEAFVVKGFSPAWVGDSVVVPEAITAKSGSDFDVDKLNTYLKNIYLDAKGDIRLVKYFATKEESDAHYSPEFDKLLAAAKANAEKSLNRTGLVFEMVQDTIYGIGDEARLDEYQDLLTKVFADVSTPDDMTELELSFQARLSKIGKRINKLNDTEFQGMLKQVYLERMYRAGLENEYFSSMEDIVLLPINFERLIKANTSAAQIKAIRKKLEDAAPNEFGSSTTKSVLNRQYMSTTRHLFLVGKGGVGIAASGQKNNSINQSAPIFLDPNNIGNIPSIQQKYIGTGRLMLPHNTVVINGQEYLTLSGTKDVKQNYISDNTSEYIDGFVDIAKDPAISQMIQHPSLTSAHIAITKTGTDLETSAFFMNQPIIRQYLKMLLNKNTTWLFIDTNITRIKSLFPSKPSTRDKITTLPNADDLLKIITRFYNGEKLTDEENAYQQIILDEFLKYSVIASNVFDMQRATNPDTDSSADPTMQHRKQGLINKARYANLFSSVDELLNNTHLGAAGERIQDASRAISESFTIINNTELKPYLNAVLDELPAKMRADEFYGAARGVEEALITYIVQTNSGMNMRFKELMVDNNRSVASRIVFLKKSLNADPKLRNSTLANNLFLRELMPLVKNRKAEVKNLMLAHKVFDSFTADMYTAALIELKNNGRTRELYNDLVLLSFLQSGVSNSPISYHKFVPVEDYAAQIKPILDRVESLANLQEFVTLGAYFRNNWSNTASVPNLREEFKENSETGQVTSKQRIPLPQLDWFEQLKTSYGITDDGYRPIRVHEAKRVAQSKYITFTYPVKGRIRGSEEEVSVDKTKLMQRLDDAQGNPIPFETKRRYKGRVITSVYYQYFPINTWGDGFRAEEHYSEIRPSALVTEGYRIEHEFSQQEIRDALIGIYTNNLVNSEEIATFVKPMDVIETAETSDIAAFTNHSGGALGSDSAWDEIGQKYGMVNNRHYYYGRQTPKGNVAISNEDLEEGWAHVLEANKALKRRPDNYKALLSRNWMQVKNADAVFGIGKFQVVQDNTKPDNTTDITKSVKSYKFLVDGGTGWAVQMAIDAGKPVYFFDQEKTNKWYQYTGEGVGWTEVETPVLTQNFAGIGTREINENGKTAIENVYKKTIGETTTDIVNTPPTGTQLNIFPEEGTNGTC